MAPSISPSRTSDFLECLLRIGNVGLRHAPQPSDLALRRQCLQIRICSPRSFLSRERKTEAYPFETSIASLNES
jgi:hypothetical protein